MPPSKTKLFGEIAITKGLLTHDQLSEALKQQQAQKATGVKKTLGAVLHDLGLLSLVQINGIMDEVAQERRRGSIEGYKIISKLGKGGMGSVYLARQASLQKLVAIKVLPPRLAQHDEDLARFKREALATATLNHPNIVQAFDVGESNGYNYLVMEYVEGETLKEVLEREGKVDEGRAIEILEQLCDALRHAWSHGIVHRDIKPANIMITKGDKVPKLLDLGLAISKKEDFAITQTGVIMGTPFYLSPEQAKSEDLDTRSDIYALGIVLFHMLTGAPPFVGDSAAVIVSKHLTAPLPDPMEHNPSLSNGICYVISKMTAKERDERYQTPDELLLDLKDLKSMSFVHGKKKTWEPPSKSLKRGRRGAAVRPLAIVAAAAIPAVLLIALTALDPWLWSRAWARLRGERALTGLDVIEERATAASEKRAREALAEAERYASDHPDDLDGIRDRFAAIAREMGAASPIGARAQARLNVLDAKTHLEAQAAFLALCRESFALRVAGKFDDARAVMRRFPTRFARTPWWTQHEREIELIDMAEAAATAARKGPSAPGGVSGAQTPGSP